MALFDDIFDTTKMSELGKHEAFAGILMLANSADGYVSSEESRGFVDALLRMNLYRI